MSEHVVAFSELADADLLEIGAGRPRSAGLDQFPLPILRVADVAEGRVLPSFQVDPPVPDSQVMGPKTSKPGDVVLTTKGTVGRVAIMPSDGSAFAYSPQLCYFRPIAKGPLRARYLYYWFKTEEFWNQADALKGQTDMADFISLSDLYSMRMRLPSIDEQVAVISILGALDDKIAANDRITTNVTRLADALFADARRAAGHQESTFEELAFVGGGGTPSTSNAIFWGGPISWATPTDVTALTAPYLDRTSRSITHEGLAACASSIYAPGSILMTSRATIGAFAIAQVPLAVNQGFIVVNAKDPRLQWWLYHEMRSRVSEFLSYANGATFQELGRGSFKRLRLRVPTHDQAAAFDEVVAPLHSFAAEAQIESERLIRARDELLPLLMSGKVRVKDAQAVREVAR